MRKDEKQVAVVDFASYEESVPDAMRQICAEEALSEQKRVIIKPNLLNLSEPPTTTDVRCVAAVAKFCRECCSSAKIIVAEGSGGADTNECYRKLGYEEIIGKMNIPLVDLDREPTVKLKSNQATVFKNIYLPKIILEGFLISVPVLKDHTITGVTISLKNLVGLLPEKYYSGYWSYKKSMIHKDDVEAAIVDINQYRPIDLAVIDAAIGQVESHMSGPHADPPVAKIIAGTDTIEVDKLGAQLLGHDWRDIEHIRIAEARLRI